MSSKESLKLGIVIFDQVEELDFVGPWEMATMWNRFAQGPDCLLVAETLSAVTCAKGLSVNPQITFSDCPQLDYLLLPGGEGTRREVSNSTMLSFIAGQANGAKSLLSVCTGSFVLHAAGLLSGKRATTHWGSLDRLRELGDVNVVEQRYVQDGTVWTSAGVSAGMDMLLAFIAATAGEDAAGKVQFGAEYYPSPRTYGNFESHPKAPGYVRDPR